MSLKADRREWNDLAERDGMWAVHSDPQRLGSWTTDEFFATGEREIASVMAGLEAHDLMPRGGRALDFGCGVGRLTRALGERFEEVVGVDQAHAMIADARRLHADRANLSFELNERAGLPTLQSGSFDFVLSLITLQHISSRAAIREYIREFARVVAPGGVIVFQLPTSVGWQIRLHPLRLLNRALRAAQVAPPSLLARLMPYSMRLAGLPEAQVRSILATAGAPVAVSLPDNRTGSDAAPSMAYAARRSG